MVYSTTLERWHTERYREFESLRLRFGKIGYALVYDFDNTAERFELGGGRGTGVSRVGNS